MCCGGKPAVPPKLNETTEPDGFSINPSAELQSIQNGVVIRQSLTREDFQNMNFARRRLKPPPLQ